MPRPPGASRPPGSAPSGGSDRARAHARYLALQDAVLEAASRQLVDMARVHESFVQRRRAGVPAAPPPDARTDPPVIACTRPTLERPALIAEALDDQRGLSGQPGPDPEVPPALEGPFDELPPAFTRGTARLESGRLGFLDAVRWWPDGGVAGRGRVRGEATVDPRAWYFRAHFFEDPVQPGSLGIEAMLQLVRLHALASGLHEGIPAARFESPGVDHTTSWSYRGQVSVTDGKVDVTADITEVRDEQGAVRVVATAWLEVDGRCIYRVEGLSLRVVPGTVERILDPGVDTWLGDHRPTHTRPVLPMMGAVEEIARAAGGALTGVRKLRMLRWLGFDGPRTLRVAWDDERVALEASTPDGGWEKVAIGMARFEAPTPPPAPMPPIATRPAPDPYRSGHLFHGPAFQLVTELHLGPEGAWARLDPSRCGVPVGRVHPGLLDASLHTIPHDRLHLWSDRIAPDMLSYPLELTELDLFGPPPVAGDVRVETRFEGLVGGGSQAALSVRIAADGVLWARFRLAAVLVPMGFVRHLPPERREGYLGRHEARPGLRVFSTPGAPTRVLKEDIQALRWMPGFVQHVFGNTDPLEIARRAHVAEHLGVHPRHVPDCLPLNPIDVAVTEEADAALARGPGPGSLDWRRIWSAQRETYPDHPMADVLAALGRRFLGRVVLTRPFDLAGRPRLYLANHQVASESVLFTWAFSHLEDRTVRVVAKEAQRTRYTGRLGELVASWPGKTTFDPILYLDPGDAASQLDLFARLREQLRETSLLVHAAGERALSARRPVERMSSKLVDLAVEAGVDIVPMRFAGGLPVAAAAEKLPFPVGYTKQDLWVGEPLSPGTMSDLPYATRRRVVMDAIDSLGPGCDGDVPRPPDEDFARRVEDLQRRLELSQTGAVVVACLSELPVLHPLLEEVLAGLEGGRLPSRPGPRGDWARRLVALLAGESRIVSRGPT